MIDDHSRASSPLELYRGDHYLAHGTCFFWVEQGTTYLVTNWHNVTGVNPENGKSFSSTGARPNVIKFDIWRTRELSARVTFPINLLDQNDNPIWLEHPTFGKLVDAVCVELPSSIVNLVFPINSLPAYYPEAKVPVVRMGDDVFVLGHPRRIANERLPIWKRASIATEISLDFDGKPMFLVDTLGDHGMSGSPVVRRQADGGVTESGAWQPMMQPAYKFLGIYSGRRRTGGADDAQLGIVWKSNVIEQIIYGRKRGVLP